MVNYQNGKIYKLVNDVNDDIYVGSTCGTLRLRKSEHKKRSRKKPNMKVYQCVNECGWDNCRIILVESFPCNNKDELLAREQHWIDELKPSLNGTGAYKRCPHGRQHHNCKDCGGKGICEHNRIRHRCKDCSGNGICEHNKEKYFCKDCKGKGICEHNKQKYCCKDCGGNGICKHNNHKRSCKQCNGDKYKCLICNKIYASKRNLTRHNKKFH